MTREKELKDWMVTVFGIDENDAVSETYRIKVPDREEAIDIGKILFVKGMSSSNYNPEILHVHVLELDKEGNIIEDYEHQQANLNLIKGE